MPNPLPLLLLCLVGTTWADPAPDFTLPVIDSEAEVHLEDFRGRVVYLDFWATWCPPCRKSFPWMDEMQSEYGEEGLSIIAISIDRERQLVQRFTEEMQPTFTVAHDPEGRISRRYGVSAMPTSFLIDRMGNIVSVHSGFRERDKDMLEERIERLLDQ